MPQLQIMPKVYSYTRMSTPEQLKGDSRRRQVDAANAYATRRGWLLEDRFDDLGVSAFHGKNHKLGALSHFLALVDSGAIERGSVLIVESIDRLSRQDISRALPLLLDLIDRGIRVVTLSPEQEYSSQTVGDATNLIGALFIMARAHEESKMKSVRGREAWISKRSEARRAGKIATRRVPGWLVVKDGRIEVDPHRAEIVREIFELARNGWGAYSISRHLNERGEVPWGKKPSAVWRESYIKKLLRSRTVLGEYQPHTVRIEDGRQIRTEDGQAITEYYPKVIDAALFREVAVTLDARRVTGRGRKGQRFGNLFTGLLRCHCGAGYRFVSKGPPPKGGDYLHCSVALAKGSCSMQPLRYGLVEEFLLGQIESLDARKVMSGLVVDQRLKEAMDEKRTLEEQLETSRNAIGKLTDFIIREGTGEGSRAVKVRLDEEERTLALATKRLTVLDLRVAEVQMASESERRSALKQLISRWRRDPPNAAILRRALAEQIRSLVDRMVISPGMHVLEELLDGGPDGSEDGEAVDNSEDWRAVFGVKSEAELRRLLKDRNFEVHIFYRSGAEERIDGMRGPVFRAKASRKMKELRLVNR